ncbi:Sec-independent protein translocase subunit TatA/TatB [Prevotella communis]|uniref:Sec-independent protein translocase subunit TatA/TatB n=1 Tax=Prevotella communis TaxID=2913614 RepID=UPI001EDAB615|nr:twin-arginine translocase TatA/TatE family subunit [Prevotella communis]UKK55852.1 twin-arginine translocase TatA/TatE family subunit [Prevotella communis]
MATQLLFIGTTELLLIGGLALLLFGGKKLPEMMRGLGQGVQSFKKGMKEPIAKTTEEDGEEAKSESEQTEETKAGQ